MFYTICLKLLIPFLLVLFSVIPNKTKSQNLVKNGSFEHITNCPYSNTHFEFVKSWLDSGYYTLGQKTSEQLFHTCGKNGYNIPNTGYGIRYPRSGNSMAAFSFWWKDKNYGISEIIQTPLKKPLKAGTRYCVSYYVRKSTTKNYNNMCIQEFSATFTQGTIILQAGPPSNYWPKPQVIHRNGIVKDTAHWTRIYGSFTAQGNEKFLTLGSYFPKDSVTRWSYGSPSSDAYYFVDDVAVWECDAAVYEAQAGPDQKICAGKSVTLGKHKLQQYQYYWFEKGNLQDTLSTKARPVFKPQKTTEYLLKVIDFKYDKTRDSVTVVVDPNCINFDNIPNVFTPNGDGFNDTFIPEPPENVTYTITIYNRWGNKLFTGDTHHHWDARHNGQKVPAGPYFYVINATHTISGATQTFSGDVSVVY